MIKCEKMKDRTVVKIEGNRIVIMEELSEIIRHARKVFSEEYRKECADEDIRECIKIAFMEDKDLEKEVQRQKEEILSRLGIDESTLEKLAELICV